MWGLEKQQRYWLWSEKKGQIAGKPNVNHNGRNEFPAHLPRVVDILTPQIVINHPQSFKKIGQQITETLDYTPAKLFVKQRVREKYVVKTASQSASQNTDNGSDVDKDSTRENKLNTATTIANLDSLENFEGVITSGTLPTYFSRI